MKWDDEVRFRNTKVIYKTFKNTNMKYFKSVLTVPMVLIIVVLFSLLYSCSEDNIVSNPIVGFDSARFNWEFDSTMGSDLLKDLFTPDTNNIFTTSHNENLVFRRTKYAKERYYFDFKDKVRLMIGDDINNSYLCGYTEGINGYDTYKPFIMKWNGSGFDKLPTNYVTSVGGFKIYAGLYVNPSEMWMACLNGKVLKYNGSDFEQTLIKDTTETGIELEVKEIFRDNQNRIKILAYYREVWYTPKYYYLFEYKNNDWELIYKQPPNENYPSYSVMNNNIVASGKTGVYSFDGQNFHQEIESDKFGSIQIVTGSAFNNLMVTGLIYEEPLCMVFHWNGNKWSKEILGFVIGDYRLNRVNDNYYVYMVSFTPYAYMHIGRRK